MKLTFTTSLALLTAATASSANGGGLRSRRLSLFAEDSSGKKNKKNKNQPESEPITDEPVDEPVDEPKNKKNKKNKQLHLQHKQDHSLIYSEKYYFH
mmetsp:Transcript_24574/g.37230  ORF Transcript_24574/g.37230 Transcript_24574/m.37230 type:complete len:97 (+) Transcript_24574:74-364(+)